MRNKALIMFFGLLVLSSYAYAINFDLNHDKKVNGIDASLIADNYGNCGCNMDMDDDGTITINDIFLFAAYIDETKTHKSKYDFNNDGIVNADDLYVLAENFGKSCSSVCYDLNHDKIVDINDVMLLAANADKKIPQKFFSADSNQDNVVDEYDVVDLLNEYIGNHIVVTFNESITVQRINEIISQYNMKLLKNINGTAVYNFEVPRNSRETIESALNNLPEVVHTEKNVLFSIPLINTGSIDIQNIQSQEIGPAGSTFPNDPYYPLQWGLKEMDIPTSWVFFTRGDPNIRVAVLDEGFVVNHEDLDHIFGMPRYNALDGGDDVLPHPEFSTGHGTAVLGIIAAKLDNGVGIAGIAPDVTIMRVRVCIHALSCPSFNVADGINWAADNGADVISMSVQPNFDTADVYDAITNAVAFDDVAVFIAAGNDDDQGADFPANHPMVIPVGGVDPSLTKTPDSNYGSDFVFAPGTDLVTTGENNDYIPFGGTSGAAPHVAGLAALYLSHVPEAYRTAEKVKNFVRMTTRDLGAPGLDNTYGHGFVQVTPQGFVGSGYSNGDPDLPVAALFGCRLYDVAPDTIIDALDQQTIAFRWGSQLGSLLYDPRYDFDSDGDIDMRDLQMVFSRHGWECDY